MNESSVSDLVFRDLDADHPSVPAFDEDLEAALREELDKLRPVRPAPRVIPASEAAGRSSRRGR